jgi:hypothetical protein
MQLWAVTSLSALVAGCAGTREHSDVRDYLEQSTGISVTYLTTAAAFRRGQPGLASSGRDHVYLGPIVVNRGGEKSCWLWLGIWSTVDRQVRNDRAGALKLGALQIVADNEPMDIDTRPVDSHAAGLDRIPYATPVAPTQELLVQVTRSQLQRLGRARTLALVDRPADGPARSWRADERAVAALSHFAGATGAVPLNPVAVTGR